MIVFVVVLFVIVVVLIVVLFVVVSFVVVVVVLIAVVLFVLVIILFGQILRSAEDHQSKSANRLLPLINILFSSTYSQPTNTASE